jgi:hypothetical protein
MVNDNIPNHLRIRRQLRDFAASRSREVQDLVWVIRGQMCAWRRTEIPGMRKIIRDMIEDNMARLKAMPH